jgi:uroporphyrinogen decarboxylase
MTPRERMLATLRHEQPDRTPFQISFTQKARAKMVAFTGDPHFDAAWENAIAWHGSLSTAGGWQEVAPGVWEDAYGVQWDRTVDPDIGVVCNTKVTPATLNDYRFPEIHDPAHLATARGDADPFVLADLGFSLFERAWTLAGMENVLAAMVDDPDFINALLDRILAFNLEVVDKACAHDIDAMMFGDDWGQQTGLIMGPALWREYIKPRIAQMYSRVHAHGKFVFIHSCGKVDAVFPDLIEIGLNAFNPFQPEVIDVAAAKREYGRDLTFFGGISTQQTLPFGTPEQTRAEVRMLLDVVGKDGGYIAAPAHSIPGDCNPENVLAMMEVLRGQ